MTATGHPQVGSFILSPAGQSILARYGFAGPASRGG